MTRDMLTNFKRIFNFALNDFGRNKGISIAAIFVLVVTIMLVTGLVFFHGMAGYLTAQIQDKIDITAYFKDGSAEEDILNVKSQILNLSPNIKNVEYVSKNQALTSFSEKHKNDTALSDALQEVGNNPFLPSLNITTTGEPQQYEEISNILQTSDFSKLIDKVDFSQKKDTIEKVYSITSNVNMFGVALSAFVICILISGFFAFFISPKISVVLPGFDMFNYFLTNLWIFVLIQLGFGIAVGTNSAFFVVKKYLDI